MTTDSGAVEGSLGRWQSADIPSPCQTDALCLGSTLGQRVFQKGSLPVMTIWFSKVLKQNNCFTC